MVAHALLDLASPFGTPAVLAALFLLSAGVAIASSNSAAAVIIAPVAGQVATAGAADLERLRRELDPRAITERIGAMFQAMLEELQARSFSEQPESAQERALAARQRHRRRAKRPFG